MPCNYPNNINVVDKTLTMCNMRFDKPVTITITYNAGFWSWLFQTIVRRRPLHHIVMVDCHFLDNGSIQDCNDGPALLRLLSVVFRRKKRGSRLSK